MIPLARWLSERDGGEGPPAAMDLALPSLSDELPPAVEQPQHAEVPARAAALEEALHAAQDEIESARREHAAREQALEARLGAEAHAHFSASLRTAMSELQHALETALTGVLMPFLGAAASRKAAAGLEVLLRETLQNAGAPLLEAGAPAPLQPALREALEQAGLAVDVKDTEKVELAFASHRARFEGLAARWIDILEGNER